MPIKSSSKIWRWFNKIHRWCIGADDGGEDSGEDNYYSVEELSFHQGDKYNNSKWILLDNQSTADILCNSELLTNIHDTDKSMKIHCNAGTCNVTHVGTLKNYGEVWYNKKAISNIISLSRIKDRYPMKYDSLNRNKFVVISKKEVVFKQSDCGIYCHSTTERAVVMVNVVKEHREGYTFLGFTATKEVRRSLGMVDYPLPKDFRKMVHCNLIQNCPVTTNDVTNADKICGPNVSTLKGKTTHDIQDPVLIQDPLLMEYVKTPREIIDISK
jgi:rhodanese-related sulfurtransferase